MHKKDAPAVGRMQFNAMGEMHYTNRGFGACSVDARSFGKYGAIGPCAASTGSSFGLSRVALSDVCANFLAIVLSHLMILRITGLNKYQRNKLTIPGFDIWSMTRPIFMRTDVC